MSETNANKALTTSLGALALLSLLFLRAMQPQFKGPSSLDSNALCFSAVIQLN